MLSNAASEESKRFFVPWREVCDKFGATRGALRKACARHNVPVIEITRKQGGLSEDAMALLMARVSKSIKA